jgi:hypothetical protein
MDAIAPGPGEMLMAQEAAKKANQVESSMASVYRVDFLRKKALPGKRPGRAKR